MKKILHTVEINAPTGKVFQAITTQAGLSSWWSNTIALEAGEGGMIDFQFVEGFNPNMKVTKLKPDQLVQWRCVGGHDNWLDNTFSFELTDKGDEQTTLLFSQIYARELDDRVYGTYNFNWGYYLDSLRMYCETGTGKPFEA